MKHWSLQHWFWLALVAAPVVWALLLMVGVPYVHKVPAVKLFLMVVVVAPVLEEIVFRGGLQTWLYDQASLRKNLFAGITPANLITSVIFAAFHAFSQPVIWAIAIFFPSLVFGWARDRTDSVLPGMVLHAWYNLGFVCLFVAN